MAVSLDTSPGSGNAYVTQAFADQYHDERLHNTAWTAASNDDRCRAIIWATRLIDTLSFKGCKTTLTEQREFPRTISADECGFVLPPTTIPLGVQEATAEMAFIVLQGDPTVAAAAVAASGAIKKAKLDVLEVEYDVGANAATPEVPDLIAKPILAMLSDFLVGGGGTGTWGAISIQRG